MAQTSQRFSIIIEEDEIFDPLSGYKDSSAEETAAPTGNQEDNTYTIVNKKTLQYFKFKMMERL